MSFTFGEAASLNLTCAEWDSLGLTWGEIKRFTFNDLLLLATRKLEKFRTSCADIPMQDATVVVIQNFYGAVQNINMSPSVPKESKITKTVLETLFGIVITRAVTLAIEQPDEIVSALMQIVIIINQIFANQ